MYLSVSMLPCSSVVSKIATAPGQVGSSQAEEQPDAPHPDDVAVMVEIVVVVVIVVLVLLLLPKRLSFSCCYYCHNDCSFHIFFRIVGPTLVVARVELCRLKVSGAEAVRGSAGNLCCRLLVLFVPSFYLQLWRAMKDAVLLGFLGRKAASVQAWRLVNSNCRPCTQCHNFSSCIGILRPVTQK